MCACVLRFGFLFFATTNAEDNVLKIKNARGELYHSRAPVIETSGSGSPDSHAPLQSCVRVLQRV
jgi:hypothetical protein